MVEVPVDTVFSVSHLVVPVLLAVFFALLVWAAAFFLFDTFESERFERVVFGATIGVTMLVPATLLGTLAAIPMGWHDTQPTEETVTRVIDGLGGSLVEPTRHGFTNELRNACEASHPSAFAVDIANEGQVRKMAVEVTPGDPCVAKIAKANR